MDFSGLARYEWLLFELAVLGWAGWQLWSLRRDRLRAGKSDGPTAGDTQGGGREKSGGREKGGIVQRPPGTPPDDRLS